MKKIWGYILFFFIECLGFLYFIPMWNFDDEGLHCLAEGNDLLRIIFLIVFGCAALMMLVRLLVIRFCTEEKLYSGIKVTANIFIAITIPLFVFLARLFL